MNSSTHSFKGKIQYGTKFVWRIQKFSELSENYKTVKTKEIFLRETCVNKWKIVLEFRVPIMNIGLQYCGRFHHKVAVVANFTLRNSKKTVFARRTLQKSFSSNGELKFCNDFMYEPSNLMTNTGDEDMKFRLCKDDVLIIEGTMTSNCCEPNRSDQAELLQSLRSSFIRNVFSDVYFEVGDEILHAHKVILSAKSRVFKRMFETNMREKLENRVILTDINMTALKTFLTFLYTGILDDFRTSMLVQVFYVADKYDVQSLTEKCRNILFSDMSIYNVHEILLLSNKHEEQHLLNSAFHHFCFYFKYIEHTSQWIKFKEVNSLFAERLERLAHLYREP